MLSTVQTDNTSSLYREKQSNSSSLITVSHSSALGIDSVTRLVRNNLLFSKASSRFSTLLFDWKVADFPQLPFMNVAKSPNFKITTRMLQALK